MPITQFGTLRRCSSPSRYRATPNPLLYLKQQQNIQYSMSNRLGQTNTRESCTRTINYGDVLWTRKCITYSKSTTSTCNIGWLVDSCWMYAASAERLRTSRTVQHLETMTSHQKSDSVNWCIYIWREQYCQISSRIIQSESCPSQERRASRFSPLGLDTLPRDCPPYLGAAIAKG